MSPEFLAQIHAKCFKRPRPWGAREFSDLLQDGMIFLIPDSHGFALGRAVADEAELLTIAVLPEARRKGLGLFLLEQFEADASARGAATAFLEVASDNRPAQSLYRRANWQSAGERPNYYARGVNAIVMRKELADTDRGAAPDPGIFTPV
ncbi:GNAT family N-acetyltransferase [Paracoccus sp. SCSIO 75233]|uniref:GNAT family N-acetyltransferase n=1 Tax=Paracoccus sp. SCSIO 75233 TaxID=3017782 RepID=UPI0022F0715D|nr:GNAT family N-acetyltransferase [Paracoccus sp. SCSIO 75233]WBU53396.1 GNAT family N-acetyltransferase [Paracoccus sp. SCSIO 75233]